jgi:hypothetical protein
LYRMPIDSACARLSAKCLMQGRSKLVLCAFACSAQYNGHLMTAMWTFRRAFITAQARHSVPANETEGIETCCASGTKDLIKFV